MKLARLGARSSVVKVRQMKSEGLGVSEIARVLKIGRASVYRVLQDG
jgi:DNA invertase Pin-like site-specific DNA recombinase